MQRSILKEKIKSKSTRYTIFFSRVLSTWHANTFQCWLRFQWKNNNKKYFQIQITEKNAYLSFRMQVSYKLRSLTFAFSRHSSFHRAHFSVGDVFSIMMSEQSILSSVDVYDWYILSVLGYVMPNYHFTWKMVVTRLSCSLQLFELFSCFFSPPILVSRSTTTLLQLSLAALISSVSTILEKHSCFVSRKARIHHDTLSAQPQKVLMSMWSPKQSKKECNYQNGITISNDR